LTFFDTSHSHLSHGTIAGNLIAVALKSRPAVGAARRRYSFVGEFQQNAIMGKPSQNRRALH
jgi:hypothetical protein